MKRVSYKKETVKGEEIMVSPPISVGCLRHLRAIRNPGSGAAAHIQVENAKGGGWRTLATSGYYHHWVSVALWALRVALSLTRNKDHVKPIKKIGEEIEEFLKSV